MLIILKKKTDSNQWNYPTNPKLFTDQFINPENNTELIAFNNSGKTLTELSDLSGYDILEFNGENPNKKPEPIMVTVDLSEEQCKLGTSIDYTITFSQPITVPFVVPISVSDRNGNHITNIGCTVTNGIATGSFTMAVAGDFTVTDEAINYHHTVLAAPLKLVEQPWLRVYQ